MKLDVTRTALPGVLILAPGRIRDQRGFFSETYNHRSLAAAGIELDIVQENHSLSRRRGVVRGLHFQTPPHAQAKLIRVTRGAILDVVVDIRCGSPTYGQHLAVELSADNWQQLLVPTGFAHGFCALSDSCEVLYKVTAYYAPDSEAGILWNDPALGIAWPACAERAIVSSRDAGLPLLADIDSPFVFAEDGHTGEGRDRQPRVSALGGASR